MDLKNNNKHNIYEKRRIKTMKIMISQLRRIIKEEVKRVIEAPRRRMSRTDQDQAMQDAIDNLSAEFGRPMYFDGTDALTDDADAIQVANLYDYITGAETWDDLVARIKIEEPRLAKSALKIPKSKVDAKWWLKSIEKIKEMMEVEFSDVLDGVEAEGFDLYGIDNAGNRIFLVNVQKITTGASDKQLINQARKNLAALRMA